MTAPSISVGMPAYNAERWIGETLETVLGQTSPAEEIIVVDDGSTDQTAAVARSFGDPVRVVRQSNGGPSAAYNRAFAEATTDYVAMCPADDLWEPSKLEWQRAALAADPRIDVACGGARTFGLEQIDFPRSSCTGMCNPETLRRELYDVDLIAAPTAVVRRELHARLGAFREDLACEDYEFWLRALRARANFFFDPRLMVHLRMHGGNLSSQALAMWEMNHRIHRMYADDVADSALVERTLARDLRTIGRCRLGLGRHDDARRAYRASLRYERRPSAAAWLLALSAPASGMAVRAVNARRRAGSA